MELLDGQERTPMVLRLESQIFYLLCKMEACMESYDKLKTFKIESLDLKTNIIAALISAGRTAEVQAMMDSLKVEVSSSFELAYNTACSLIEKGKYADGQERNPMVLQLESQIFYLLCKMEACMESYDNLKTFKIESLDLKTNIIAALISAGRAAEVQAMMDSLKVKVSSSFELAYNIACSLIEKGKYADA